VLCQSYDDYEVIVVDDGSTDNTSEIVKQYGDKIHYIHQDNAGVSVARNNGIKTAKGDWIAFLDADDEWLPEKLRLQTELLQRNPELKWCAANRYQSDGEHRAPLRDSFAIRKGLGGSDFFESFFSALTKGFCLIITSVMVVKREVFDEAGLFEPGREAGEDIDLWWRIAYRYPKIGYIPEPAAIIYLDAGSETFIKRRLSTKRAPIPGGLIDRHLKLAEKEGCLEAFKPYAKKRLRKKVITAIYHGYKDDVRKAASYFKEFFPWYWRAAVYILTIFPKLTSSISKTVAYLGYKLRLDRQVTRRWLNSEKSGNSNP
jgi:glycosyltransferase involved in cell wall biosynthesis